jgi:hypothetical protein
VTAALLKRTQQDLAEARMLIAAAARWIHDPAYDYTARRALAQALQLPAPEK